jgi:hypothetical protein
MIRNQDSLWNGFPGLLAVLGGADHVVAALFQPLFLPGHGQDLTGANADLPDFHYDTDL